ncbi:Endonuclease YncB, thermonuclease family [Devosia sp. YR412]|uniref:thermonuclease family protein n=1 Tax=Devosia sp. YR412 TaxID=1881030 RepID=UPI0008D39AA8|nr:thermonuclease family protein [Devosia sp. YR412]SEP75853.1 Endonuclease YncB, thermonuclease family [Devosia sp. YR412]
MLVAALEPASPPLIGQARASDGDSFRMGDIRIRLLGIDAPELAQLCDDAKGQSRPCGRTARDRLAGLLAAASVDCQSDGHDQYGRTLATCSVQGRDLGSIMVSEGLAISSGGYWHEEGEARAEGRGIWAGGFDTPSQWRRDNARPSGLFDWLGSFWR